MKRTIILAVAAIIASGAASATSKPAPRPAQPASASSSMLATQDVRNSINSHTNNHVDANADANANSSANSDAHSSSRSSSNAQGGNARAHGGTANAAGGHGGKGGSVGNIDAGSSIGTVAPQQTVGGDTIKSLALSLAVQPPAFTPPMPIIANCAAHIKQSASSGWIILGGYSQANAETDPTHCTLLDIRNAKVEACQYGDAQRIEDLMAAKMLPGYESSGARHINLTPEQCRMIKSPPPTAAPIVNHIAAPLRVDAPIAPKACPSAVSRKAKRRTACQRV